MTEQQRDHDDVKGGRRLDPDSAAETLIFVAEHSTCERCAFKALFIAAFRSARDTNQIPGFIDKMRGLVRDYDGAADTTNREVEK